MPTRITPSVKLRPCNLNLASIEGITALVEREFPESSFAASDGYWEVYDETRDNLLAVISERETLDSFVARGASVDQSSGEVREVTITFNIVDARVDCSAPVRYHDWFEHFMIDLRKHVLPREHLLMKVLVHAFLNDTEQVVVRPYCKIVLREKAPNPFTENVKANLVSNLIWLVAGVLFTLFLQWLFNNFGIDLNPFK